MPTGDPPSTLSRTCRAEPGSRTDPIFGTASASRCATASANRCIRGRLSSNTFDSKLGSAATICARGWAAQPSGVNRYPGNSCLPPGAAAVELTETCALIFAGPLVFIGQHDRDHPLRDRRISWVGGVVREGLVVVIDLEKDPMAIRIERAKVVLFARIVGVAKVVEHRDGFDDAGDGFGAEGGNARGHRRHALGKVLTQFIVQRADARSLAVHDGPPDLGGEGNFQARERLRRIKPAGRLVFRSPGTSAQWQTDAEQSWAGSNRGTAT